MQFSLPLFVQWMQEIRLRGVKYALIVVCFCLSWQYLCKTWFLTWIFSGHYFKKVIMPFLKFLLTLCCIVIKIACRLIKHSQTYSTCISPKVNCLRES